jgi:hypothetical protein
MSWRITGTQKVFTWDAAEDLRKSLSGTRTNPNGVWSYGRLLSLSSTSITLVTQAVSTGWQDTAGGNNYNTPVFNLNDLNYIGSHTPITVGGNTAVIRWIAPISCTVSIDSSVSKSVSAGNGIIFAVYKNSSPLFTGTAINGPTGVSSYTGDISVIIGDFIDFKVNNNADSGFDSFNYTKLLLVGTI